MTARMDEEPEQVRQKGSPRARPLSELEKKALEGSQDERWQMRPVTTLLEGSDLPLFFPVAFLYLVTKEIVLPQQVISQAEKEGRDTQRNPL